ncbi:bacterial extracellular solute-binding s, 5 Middle family protein, partial [Vibrio parahaemolyticus V-223/04]
LKCG